jgi:hypothetical protein
VSLLSKTKQFQFPFASIAKPEVATVIVGKIAAAVWSIVLFEVRQPRGSALLESTLVFVLCHKYLSSGLLQKQGDQIWPIFLLFCNCLLWSIFSS